VVALQVSGTVVPARDWAISEPEEQPLLAPVTPGMSWAYVHSLGQIPVHGPHSPEAELITAIRRTAKIRRGTRMIKLLSHRQLGAYLHGRLPSGFCYRAVDVAHLRTPAELVMLTGDTARPDSGGTPVVFGLRWRAVDPGDYAIPFSARVHDLPAYPGLFSISPHDRVGPAVLGTGFAPSRHHLIPEFVTADLADLPLPATSSLVAFAADGTEVTLYVYLPEQRAWTRMFGPQWKHLMAGVPEIPQEQEYLPIALDRTGGPRLVGRYRGELYDALADPPHEFRVHARARAARYPVETLARRTGHAVWRGAACTVVRVDGDWLRLRLCRPDRDSVPVLGAQCLERGLYEVWATAADVGEIREVDIAYDLDPGPAAP
jgi:hypothetical protein